MIEGQTHTLGTFRVRCPHCYGYMRLWGEPLARVLACPYARLDGRNWSRLWQRDAGRDGSDAERKVDPIPSVDFDCPHCKKRIRIGVELTAFKPALPRARAIHQGPPERGAFIGKRSILIVADGWLHRGQDIVAEAMGDVPPGHGVLHIIGTARDIEAWADRQGYETKAWGHQLGQGRGPKNRAALKQMAPSLVLFLRNPEARAYPVHGAARASRLMQKAHGLINLAREDGIEVREHEVLARPQQFIPRVVS